MLLSLFGAYNDSQDVRGNWTLYLDIFFPLTSHTSTSLSWWWWCWCGKIKHYSLYLNNETWPGFRLIILLFEALYHAHKLWTIRVFELAKVKQRLTLKSLAREALCWTECFQTCLWNRITGRWWGWTLPVQQPRNFSNGRQTTSLSAYTKMSKLIIKGTTEVIKSNLCGLKELNLSSCSSHPM